MDDPARADASSGAPADPQPAERSPADRAQAERVAADRARDRALVETALGGELDAFNRLVELYQDYLFGVTVRVLGGPRGGRGRGPGGVLQRLPQPRPLPGRLVPQLADAHRAQRRHGHAARQEAPARRSVPRVGGRQLAAADRRVGESRADGHRPRRSRTIAAALSQITADQRTAIVLFDVEGYDYQEIADMTGVSLGTVKSRIHRGRLALRDLLADEMELLRE